MGQLDDLEKRVNQLISELSEIIQRLKGDIADAEKAVPLVEMEAWDQEYIGMEVPGHFTLNKDGTGHFQFGLVQGEMDCRIENSRGMARIEFSWEGQEELDPVSGRGWAVIEEGELTGRLKKGR